jgi:hypothetical protein
MSDAAPIPDEPPLAGSGAATSAPEADDAPLATPAGLSAANATPTNPNPADPAAPPTGVPPAPPSTFAEFMARYAPQSPQGAPAEPPPGNFAEFMRKYGPADQLTTDPLSLTDPSGLLAQQIGDTEAWGVLQTTVDGAKILGGSIGRSVDNLFSDSPDLGTIAQPLDLFARGLQHTVLTVKEEYPTAFNLFLAAITRGKTPESEEGAVLRPYGKEGGHHVPAKSAFRDDPIYDPKTALAIPDSELAAQGVKHSVVTGAQQNLYRAYAQTGQPMTWDAIRSIEIQALTRAGMNSGSASVTVDNAINAMKASGIRGPVRIPWGGR